MGRTPWSAADPQVGSSVYTENSAGGETLSCLTFYRRRLPHLYTQDQPVFITWRLHDSLPPNRSFPPTLSSGQAFAAMDRLLDEARSGKVYLRQPAIADMVAEAIHYNADVLGTV